MDDKYRFTVRLSPEANRLMTECLVSGNCQSRNEFTENAVRFYAGYLMAKDSTEYLAPVISQMIHGTLDGFCAHISRNMFRLSVEEAITWNIIAGLIRVSPDQLRRIHNKALAEVKRLKVTLTYEDIYKDPVPLEYDLDIESLIKDEDE